MASRRREDIAVDEKTGPFLGFPSLDGLKYFTIDKARTMRPEALRVMTGVSHPDHIAVSVDGEVPPGCEFYIRRGRRDRGANRYWELVQLRERRPIWRCSTRVRISHGAEAGREGALRQMARRLGNGLFGHAWLQEEVAAVRLGDVFDFFEHHKLAPRKPPSRAATSGDSVRTAHKATVGRIKEKTRKGSVAALDRLRAALAGATMQRIRFPGLNQTYLERSASESAESNAKDVRLAKRAINYVCTRLGGVWSEFTADEPAPAGAAAAKTILSASQFERLLVASCGPEWDSDAKDWRRADDGALVFAPLRQRLASIPICVLSLLALVSAGRGAALCEIDWRDASRPNSDLASELLDVAGPNPTSSNKLRPVADLNSALIVFLRALLRWADRLGATTLVFQPDGRPYPRIAYRTWYRVLKRAGLPPFPPHSLKAMAIAAKAGAGLGTFEISATTRTSAPTIDTRYNGAGRLAGLVGSRRALDNMFGGEAEWGVPASAPDDDSLAALAAGRIPSIAPTLRTVMELIDAAYSELLERRERRAAPVSRRAPAARARGPRVGPPERRRFSSIVLPEARAVTDEIFAFLAPFLPMRGTPEAKKAALDGAIFVAATGRTWRSLGDLPGRPFGNWDTVHGAHHRWVTHGCFARAKEAARAGVADPVLRSASALIDGLLALSRREPPSFRPRAADPRRRFVPLDAAEGAACAALLGGGDALQAQLNGLLWRAETGGRWPDLPPKFGNPQTVRWRGTALVDSGRLARCVRALQQPGASLALGVAAPVRLAERLASLLPVSVPAASGGLRAAGGG